MTQGSDDICCLESAGTPPETRLVLVHILLLLSWGTNIHFCRDRFPLLKTEEPFAKAVLLLSNMRWGSFLRSQSLARRRVDITAKVPDTKCRDGGADSIAKFSAYLKATADFAVSAVTAAVLKPILQRSTNGPTADSDFHAARQPLPTLASGSVTFDVDSNPESI